MVGLNFVLGGSRYNQDKDGGRANNCYVKAGVLFKSTLQRTNHYKFTMHEKCETSRQNFQQDFSTTSVERVVMMLNARHFV